MIGFIAMLNSVPIMTGPSLFSVSLWRHILHVVQLSRLAIYFNGWEKYKRFRQTFATSFCLFCALKLIILAKNKLVNGSYFYKLNAD